MFINKLLITLLFHSMLFVYLTCALPLSIKILGYTVCFVLNYVRVLPECAVKKMLKYWAVFIC